MSPKVLSFFFKMSVSTFALHIPTSSTIFSDVHVASGQTMHIHTNKNTSWKLFSPFKWPLHPSFDFPPDSAGAKCRVPLCLKLETERSHNTHSPFRQAPWKPHKQADSVTPPVVRIQALPSPLPASDASVPVSVTTLSVSLPGYQVIRFLT